MSMPASTAFTDGSHSINCVQMIFVMSLRQRYNPRRLQSGYLGLGSDVLRARTSQKESKVQTSNLDTANVRRCSSMT